MTCKDCGEPCNGPRCKSCQSGVERGFKAGDQPVTAIDDDAEDEGGDEA